jgi:hypothetical protein
MFTRFVKNLPTIKVQKEERKHETREELEKHLHISILDPPKIDFHTFSRFSKEKFLKYLYYWWIQKSIKFDAKDPRPKKPRHQIEWVN